MEFKLLKLTAELQVETLKEIRKLAENFDALSAAVDKISAMITEAVSIIQNPHVDNNNQDTIDAITLRLSAAADALSAVEPAANPAPTAAPAPVAAAETSTDTTSTSTDASATDTTSAPATDSTATDPSATPSA